MDIISPSAVTRPKNRPVPRQREDGRTFLIRAFVAAMNASNRTVSTRQTVRMDMAFRKKHLYVFHMGNFPLIEEFPLLSSHGGFYMQVLPVPAQVIHHLIRYMEKVVHGHGRKAVQHIVFGVFFFKISGCPVNHCFHGSDEQDNHDAECGRNSGQSV